MNTPSKINTIYRIVCLIFLPLFLGACVSNKVYTSASYGGIKKYVEKPLYKGEKASAVYLSGGVRKSNHPQLNTISDETLEGSFSVHRAIAVEHFKFYYGLGAALGKYKFNTSYMDSKDSITYFNKGDELNYHNFNLRLGFNYTKSWEKLEFNVVGLEIIYINEGGEYSNKLAKVPKRDDWEIAIIDQKALLAFNINTEAIFKVDESTNIGIGFFIGDTLFRNKERSYNLSGYYNGAHLKGTHKRFTLSLVYEEGKFGIRSTSLGLTYKFLNK